MKFEEHFKIQEIFNFCSVSKISSYFIQNLPKFLLQKNFFGVNIKYSSGSKQPVISNLRSNFLFPSAVMTSAVNLHQPNVLEPNVGPQAAPNNHAEQHHDLFPSCLCLIFKSFFGVIRSSGSVLHSTLNMSINSEEDEMLSFI